MQSLKHIAVGFAGNFKCPFVVQVDAFDQQHVNHTDNEGHRFRCHAVIDMVHTATWLLGCSRMAKLH